MREAGEQALLYLLGLVSWLNEMLMPGAPNALRWTMLTIVLLLFLLGVLLTLVLWPLGDVNADAMQDVHGDVPLLPRTPERDAWL